MVRFWSDYPNIQGDLEQVKNIMRNSVKCNQKIIEKSLLDFIDSGGKLLRPAFLLLSGRFGSYESNKLYPLAAVIEMIHMATLIHDDIVDDAESRRGIQTIQSKYGKDYAVYIGDFLFTRCFQLLSDNTSMENMRNISKVISRVCIGEIEQYSSRYNQNLSVKKYLKRIAAKTSALFSLSFYIGASESGCDKKLCKHLAKTGYYIGMAFQIMDDVLDYIGSEKTFGKPICNDLMQGVFTLPLIYALKKEKNVHIKSILTKKIYNDREIEEVKEFAKNSGGIEKSMNIAQKYTQKAFKHIIDLPNNESKEILMGVTKKLLVREY